MFDPVRPHPWDSPGKNTAVGCHFLLQCMKVKVKVKSFSQVWLFMTPRLLGPWGFPGKSTGVGCHCLLRITKALQGCKNDIMQLCKSDSYKSFQHRPFPLLFQKTRGIIKMSVWHTESDNRPQGLHKLFKEAEDLIWNHWRGRGILRYNRHIIGRS